MRKSTTTKKTRPDLCTHIRHERKTIDATTLILGGIAGLCAGFASLPASVAIQVQVKYAREAVLHAHKLACHDDPVRALAYVEEAIECIGAGIHQSSEESEEQESAIVNGGFVLLDLLEEAKKRLALVHLEQGHKGQAA